MMMSTPSDEILDGDTAAAEATPPTIAPSGRRQKKTARKGMTNGGMEPAAKKAKEKQEEQEEDEEPADEQAQTPPEAPVKSNAEDDDESLERRRKVAEEVCKGLPAWAGQQPAAAAEALARARAELMAPMSQQLQQQQLLLSKKPPQEESAPPPTSSPSLGTRLDPARKEGFTCTLDAPTSSSVRPGEDALTYLNRDHFYTLVLEYTPVPGKVAPAPGSVVTSIVALQFRERKTTEEARQHWDFWHGRHQHAPGLRLLDCDGEQSSGMVEGVRELAHNALAVRWRPSECPARVAVALRCLSTDFTAQKGVKGIPMHIQVDTYGEGQNCLYDRAFLQVETFCDKGAEGKFREEEKKRRQLQQQGQGQPAAPLPTSLFQRALDLVSPMMFYTPSAQQQQQQTPATSTLQMMQQQPLAPQPHQSPAALAAALARKKRGSLSSSPDRILFYARQDNENVYTPFHVVPPTVLGLVKAVSAKYHIDCTDIRYVYKQNARGIVVKVDDDMVRYYSHGEAFIMKVLASEQPSTGRVTYDILFYETKEAAAASEQQEQQAAQATAAPTAAAFASQEATTPETNNNVNHSNQEGAAIC